MRKEQLEQAGIRCMIKNQRSAGLAGEIPFTEVFPELWVLQEQDYDQARQLLEEETVLPPKNQDFWICSGCGERHEGQCLLEVWTGKTLAVILPATFYFIHHFFLQTNFQTD